MSDIIKLLPDSVANQIAAGEVIQRPASVIKELVENSVDAGATEIKIYIKDAGRTMIQIVDNGSGMSETDARMAFERHATSKIRSASDLFALSTMGFRGEALPSICAISQVEVKTRTENQQIGTHLMIKATKVESQQPVACEKGTSISVKNLFFNVPARRKFLKSDNVELSNIMREFERLALVNNKIRMSIDTGNKTLDLRPASFKQRINDIWKSSLDLQLLPIEVDTALIKIKGFVSRPEYARRRNPLQYLIVNGRNMKHPYFHKAIVGCYDSLIAQDTQPCYFLKFEVDPDTIDVNIHPTKNEIKFENEQEIWPILHASVKAALGKFGAVPSIDFSLDTLPVAPLREGELPKKPSLDIPEDYNPFTGTVIGDPNKQFSGKYNEKKIKINENWDELYSNFMKNTRGFGFEEKSKEEEDKLPGLINDTKNNLLCLQLLDKYIVTTSREGIIIIDQRRAHIKILFEDFKKNISVRQPSMGMMFPDSIEIDPSLQESLEEIMPELQLAGFQLEYESENRWNITGIPSYAVNIDARDIILGMLESVVDSSYNYGTEKLNALALTDRLAYIMARQGAVKYGQKLNETEMETIVSNLFSLGEASYTPKGERIFTVITESKLNSYF
ncbi:MAG: DNA mismatch repair endonuclease MutL [Muribaculaceae bacterium]|nr:DNA mismatch repair endonuclease MutL [Muribaculaceae bacterium]